MDQVSDVCLEELVRINKEIETVRHQVEQEQKQLSNYQTVQADKRSLTSISPLPLSKTSKATGTGAYEQSPCSYLQGRKYVVDNSKPRTDLEYDPLSNFSSDLSSYSSSRREQKLKNGQTLKKPRIMGPSDQKRLGQTQLSRVRSPEPEWMEDDILIIDIPPSPQKKEGQGQKHSHSGTNKSLQGHKINKDEGPSILLDSPPQYSQPEVLDIDDNDDDNSAESKNLANVRESGPCDNLSKTSGTDLNKSLEPSGAVLTNLQVDKETKTLQANLSHFDPLDVAGKINPLQQNLASNTSLLKKATSANSGLQCRALVEQAQNMSCVPGRFGNLTSLVNTPSVLPHGQKSSAGTPAPIQDKPENCTGQEQHISSSQTQSDESSASNQLLEKDADRVIVIDSSSDDDRSYMEIELSDSDPMEECYRIFMEENEQKPTEELADENVSAPGLMQKYSMF